jgi:hypothetical protein
MFKMMSSFWKKVIRVIVEIILDQLRKKKEKK